MTSIRLQLSNVGRAAGRVRHRERGTARRMSARRSAGIDRKSTLAFPTNPSTLRTRATEPHRGAEDHREMLRNILSCNKRIFFSTFPVFVPSLSWRKDEDKKGCSKQAFGAPQLLTPPSTGAIPQPVPQYSGAREQFHMQAPGGSVLCGVAMVSQTS